MSRADLRALTPQAIAALSNAGLVKRAQKELEQGKGPRLEELADGTVVGTYEDGTVARLVPGKGLKDSPCSCGASAVCRHRVAIALAYAAGVSSEAGAAPVTSTGAPPAAWSPGAVTDDELAAALPARVLERARAIRKSGFIAQIHRGTLVGEDVPRASLATCTLTFLVPRELGYARCDCTARSLCEHLPLAVWAFREADRRDPALRELSVEIADARIELAGGAALTAAEELARIVLVEGVQHLSEGPGARFAMARDALEKARMAWLAGAAAELEELLSAYGARSARYTPGRARSVVTELLCRTRAARGPSTELPARAVLGLDEAPETPLDHLRLLSLGARVSAEGRERTVEVLLADPASGSLLVLRRAFTYRENERPEDGPALAARGGLPGSTLEGLARGQAVTSGATRLPNRLVVVSTRGLQRTSVLPQNGDWSGLPPALLVHDVSALATRLRARPPRMLRSRLLAENTFAFAISRVLEVSYEPGAQSVRARVEDMAAHEFAVELVHRSVAPGGLEALAAALGSTVSGQRFLSGDARLGPEGMVVTPIAVSSAGLPPVVLDFAAPASTAIAPRGLDAPPAGAVAAVQLELEGCLDESVHQGLDRAGPGLSTRLVAAGERARAVGMARVHGSCVALARALEGARAQRGVPEEAALLRAWTDLAARAAIAAEHGG